MLFHTLRINTLTHANTVRSRKQETRFIKKDILSRNQFLIKIYSSWLRALSLLSFDPKLLLFIHAEVLWHDR